jgi:endonuclease YncB( thermonuclease family)
MARHVSQKKLVSLLATAIVAVIVALSQQYGWFGQAQQAVEQSSPGLYTIKRFVDGDTIVVDMNGTDETVRMIGVDTPETHKPNSPVQCYGPAASAYTKNLIGSQKVRLEADPTNQNRDRYNRLLRYAYLPDGKLIAEEVIANGYGFAYTQFPFTKKDQFVQAEEQAKAANRGLWGNCTVDVQQNGRKQTNNAN